MRLFLGFPLGRVRDAADRASAGSHHRQPRRTPAMPADYGGRVVFGPLGDAEDLLDRGDASQHLIDAVACKASSCLL